MEAAANLDGRANIRAILESYSLNGDTSKLSAYHFGGDWAHLGKYDYGPFLARSSDGFIAILDRDSTRAAALEKWAPHSASYPSCKPTGPQGTNTNDAKLHPDVEKRLVEHPTCTVTYWSQQGRADVAILHVKASVRKRRKGDPQEEEEALEPIHLQTSPPIVTSPMSLLSAVPPPQPLPLQPLPLALTPPAAAARVLAVPSGQCEREQLCRRLIKAGDAESLRYLLLRDRTLLVLRLYTYGFTLLHEACRERQLTVVEMLVCDFDADVNAVNEDNGSTPLHQAAYHGAIDVVRFLIEHGARLDVRTRGNYLPVHNASNQGHEAIVDLLLAQHHAPEVFRAPSQRCNMDLIADWERLHKPHQRGSETVESTNDTSDTAWPNILQIDALSVVKQTQ